MSFLHRSYTLGMILLIFLLSTSGSTLRVKSHHLVSLEFKGISNIKCFGVFFFFIHPPAFWKINQLFPSGMPCGESMQPVNGPAGSVQGLPPAAHRCPLLASAHRWASLSMCVPPGLKTRRIVEEAIITRSSGGRFDALSIPRLPFFPFIRWPVGYFSVVSILLLFSAPRTALIVPRLAASCPPAELLLWSVNPPRGSVTKRQCC